MVGSSVSVKPPHQNRFTDLELDSLLASPGQSAFAGTVNGTKDGGNEWSNVNKITESTNIYPCSHRMSTKLTIEDMYRHPGGVSKVKAKKAIADTVNTHEINPNYAYLLSYHHSSSGYCVTIYNRGKYNILGYSHTMMRLGRRVYIEVEFITCTSTRTQDPPLIAAPAP